MNVHICPRVHWNRPPFEMDTGFSAIGVANGYWFPLPFHVCWNEVSGIFFLSGRRFLLFCQKVRVCCPLQLIKRPHHDLASESRCAKYTIQNCTVFSINRSYVLQLWQANTVPYSTKPAERVLPAHSRINMDPFLRAELSREAPSELAIEKILKMYFRTLRSLLNCRSEMHLTTHKTQFLTQQTTRDVSLC